MLNNIETVWSSRQYKQIKFQTVNVRAYLTFYTYVLRLRCSTVLTVLKYG